MTVRQDRPASRFGVYDVFSTRPHSAYDPSLGGVVRYAPTLDEVT